MPIKKGETLNPYGRPKNSQNKTTKEIRNIFSELLSANLENLQSDLNKLEPKERITILLKLSEFVVPKLQSTQMAVTETNSTTIKIGYGSSLDVLTEDELSSLEAMQKKVGYKPRTVVKWGEKEIEV